MEKVKELKDSKRHALSLYERWVNSRQKRPELEIPQSEEEQKRLGLKNFIKQKSNPRKMHLEELKNASNEMYMSDIVALLIKLELPVLETSTLILKLSRQLKKDPKAKYFSEINQRDNCGSGCGSNCLYMENLPYEERLYLHHANKPFAIDPFNELGISKEKRDSLLITDLLKSHSELSKSIEKNIDSEVYK